MRRFLTALLSGALAVLAAIAPCRAAGPDHRLVPVLVYHRFATSAVDGMTVRTDNFKAHLRTIEDAGYRFVSLADVLAWQRGEAQLPERVVAITVDDGHRSVFDVLWPLLQARTVPVPITLFIYPSAISNALYALSWEQLRRMRQSGSVDIESHTYWHPNFNAEHARRSPEEFRRFVAQQMQTARVRLQAETGAPATLLAWPFGIHDPELEAMAVAAGYVAAFSIDGRAVSRSDRIMALPRYLITDSCSEKCIANILRSAEHGGE
jgi:peptidoglycan/xylan/chitin deacetylase (PgdA/CDA1 family)